MPKLSLIYCSLYIVTNIFVHQIAGQVGPQEFLSKYLDKRDKYSAYQFDVYYESKFYGWDDTLIYQAEVEVVRKPEDTLYGGLIYIELDTVVYAYNGHVVMDGRLNTSRVFIHDPERLQDRSIKLDWTEPIVEYAFLTRNQTARNILRNEEIRHQVVDTLIGVWPCKGFYYYLPDQEEITNQQIFVAIDTIELMVRKRVISSWFQENEQFQSWTYLNPRYGQQTVIDKLNDDFLSSFQYQEYYKSRFLDTTIVNKIDYSSLEGKLMNSEEKFSVKSINSKVIILDFWYSSCYPCIKSIPEINKLYDQFHDRGVSVFGVNIIDDDIQNKTRIEKYVRNNPMKYKTIMADRTTYDHWVPEGYPMLLILNNNFELIKMHTGYTEHMADELAEIIEEVINE